MRDFRHSISARNACISSSIEEDEGLSLGFSRSEVVS